MQDLHNRLSGFDGTLVFGQRPALLVVDFQRGFTETALSPLASDCSDAITSTNQVIDAMRGKGPIIFTILGYEPNLTDMGVWGRKCTSLDTLKRGTAACEIDPRLNYMDASDLILSKTQASAFFGTALNAILAANQCDSLIIVGCTTSGCVRASVVDAMQYAYPPFVVEECCADRSLPQHNSNLIDMQSKYAEVVGVERLLQLLCHTDLGESA